MIFCFQQIVSNKVLTSSWFLVGQSIPLRYRICNSTKPMSKRYDSPNDNDVYLDGLEGKDVPEPENREARSVSLASLSGQTSKHSDVNANKFSKHANAALQQDSDAERVHFSHQTEMFSSNRSTSTSEVATGTTSSLNVPAARTLSSNSVQYSDHVRPPAPSSVKSYGSNLGSEDCGGSLDVEANSDDARSIDETFPVSMPDHDLETAAVASLSITPVETGEYFKFPVRYSNQDSLASFTMHRFRRNSFDSHVDNDPVGTGPDSQSKLPRDDTPSGDIVRNIDSADADGTRGRIHADWNDPRIDEPSSREMKRSSRALLENRKGPAESTSRSRSRSRSRSPPRES